jgi:hypothetical protein
MLKSVLLKIVEGRKSMLVSTDEGRKFESGGRRKRPKGRMRFDYGHESEIIAKKKYRIYIKFLYFEQNKELLYESFISPTILRPVA